MGRSEPVSLPVDAAAFRRVLGCFATGVTVLTTRSGGVDHAMTANSLTSVSVNPALMLVCVEQTARFHDAVIQAGVWGVSILPASGQEIASGLATRGRPSRGQLDDIPHRAGPTTGVALLRDSPAQLECRTVAVHPGGDHSIIVAEVQALYLKDVVEPALLYYRGHYAAVD